MSQDASEQISPLMRGYNLTDSLPAAEGKRNDWVAIFNVSCV
jgi:hypothetical protein